MLSFTSFVENNITKFITIQIITNTVILKLKLESIPVGCVPSAAVAVGGVSAPVHAGIPAGWVCLPQCMLGYLPAGWGVSAQVHAGIHPPPVNRILDTRL